jgi:AI-2E family transporter
MQRERDEAASEREPPDESLEPQEAEQALNTAPAPAVEPVVVPRWVQLVTLPLAIFGLVGLLRAAGPIVLLFTIAALIALLLNPFVSVLRRRGVPRGLAVLITWLALLLVIVGIAVLLANPITDQVSKFRDSVPGLVDDATHSLDQLQAWLDRNGVRVQIQEQGQSALATIGDNLAKGSGEVVSFTRDALTVAVEASIALILVLVLSIYMLLYGEQIGDVVRRIVPKGDGTPEDDFPVRVQAAVFGYVRGQFLFSLIMGASAGVGLLRLRRADPVHRAGDRRVSPGRGGGALRQAARRGLARHLLHGAAADRGTRRGAERVCAGAAHQPVARHPRPAVGRPAVWVHWRVRGATGRRRHPRDGRLHAPSPGARALGHAFRGGSAAAEGGAAARGVSGVRRAAAARRGVLPGLRHRAGFGRRVGCRGVGGPRLRPGREHPG